MTSTEVEGNSLSDLGIMVNDRSVLIIRYLRPKVYKKETLMINKWKLSSINRNIAANFLITRE